MSLGHYHKRFIQGYNSCGKYLFQIIVYSCIICFLFAGLETFEIWTLIVLFITILAVILIVEIKRAKKKELEESQQDNDDNEFHIEDMEKWLK